MRERLSALPKGQWRNELSTDGYDEPIDLAANVTIGEDAIHVDFAGSAPVSRWGINVPLIYGKAYASYGLKCVVAPDVPNNSASLASSKFPRQSTSSTRRGLRRSACAM